jgi:ribosomal protein S6--L-glutamate ligase
MNRIAVFGSTDSWYYRDLCRAAAKNSAAARWNLVPATFRQLASTVGDQLATVRSGDVDLATVDAVLVRTMPAGSLEQVVFRMDALARLEAAGVRVLNPARGIEAAVDKYLATAKLAAAGLTVPTTVACQTVDDALAAMHSLGGDVVVKPLFGAEGRGITRLTDEAIAWRAFKLLEELRAVIYLQPFLEHEGHDLRLLVIGDEVFGIRRAHPTDWRTNISRGARAERLDVTPELADLARRAAAAVDAPLAGVDVLPARDGRLYVLEVNAVPGWRALASTLEIDIARRVLEFACPSPRT